MGGRTSYELPKTSSETKKDLKLFIMQIICVLNIKLKLCNLCKTCF
jgi:hypothetical protein